MPNTFTTGGIRVEPASLYGEPVFGFYTHTIVYNPDNSRTVVSVDDNDNRTERTFPNQEIWERPQCGRCCRQAVASRQLEVQMALNYSHTTGCGQFPEKTIDGSNNELIFSSPSPVRADGVCAFYK